MLKGMLTLAFCNTRLIPEAWIWPGGELLKLGDRIRTLHAAADELLDVDCGATSYGDSRRRSVHKLMLPVSVTLALGSCSAASLLPGPN